MLYYLALFPFSKSWNMEDNRNKLRSLIEVKFLNDDYLSNFQFIY